MATLPSAAWRSRLGLLVHFVPLAELERLGAVVELSLRDQALLREQGLEAGEPALVVAQGLGPLGRAPDLVDEAPLEFLPGVVALIVEGHGHSEDAALPWRLEHQLAVLARHRDGALHVGDETVRLDSVAERGRRDATGGGSRRSRAKMEIVHGLAVGPRFPGGGGEAIGGEGGGRLYPLAGLDELLDPVVEGQDLLRSRHGMKPRLPSLEEQHDHVGEGAGAEAAADGEVHAIAQAPSLPFLVVELARHRLVAVLHAPTAAGVRADEELAERTRHVDAAAVGAMDDVAHYRAAAGEATCATPIMASRVTRAASSASERCSDPSGRIGTTM